MFESRRNLEITSFKARCAHEGCERQATITVKLWPDRTLCEFIWEWDQKEGAWEIDSILQSPIFGVASGVLVCFCPEHKKLSVENEN